MAVLSKDEARRARAGRHATSGEACEGCDRTVHGNGGKTAHYRKCPEYLALHGWTFNAVEMAALRQAATDSTDNADAWWKFIKAARMAEARRRGLLPAEA